MTIIHINVQYQIVVTIKLYHIILNLIIIYI